MQQTAAGASTASLIAIPLFIFAGELMMRGGISERLIAFASSLVGHLRGGLGQVNVLASLFFGGVSGSAIADVSAIGGTMIPQMVKRGFDRDFAVNVIDHRGAGRAAGAAVAQPDSVFGVGRRLRSRSPTCSRRASCRRC